jgi:hypothetical protein
VNTDIAAILTKLGQADPADPADPRDLRRVCDATAAALAAAGVEPPFRVRVADAVADPWLMCFCRQSELLPVNLFGSNPRRSDAARSAGSLQQFSVLVG